ncbi:hypothetical protein [Sulfitobacter noctilucicola]|uniref:Dihydroorotate dehydrogenase n=1 Tax=Sulfitobacter noctilucicola TaxID=1342301 RepID=A0A7W6MC24_9RHOB|nr:hypothetical protein [Sulfitobacter noctilucicola]MBB4175326.1 hypothetical protein [Sulfitobacter noctilucicola]
MTSRNQNNDAMLEDLFQQARATPPHAPDALMERVLADAQQEQPRPAFKGWRDWLGALGGIPGLSGLVTASCVGFWLGIAPPDAVPDLTATVWGVETEYTEDSFDSAGVSAFGWDIEEDATDG